MDAAHDLEALAQRCDERAIDLATEAELLQIELASHDAQKDTRWKAYEANKGESGVRQWRMFYNRMESTRSNLKMTREDEQHYRACAASLRAPRSKL